MPKGQPPPEGAAALTTRADTAALQYLEGQLGAFRRSAEAWCCSQLLDLSAKPVGLTDFTLLRRVGRGSFGQVFVARKEDTMALCALNARDSHTRAVRVLAAQTPAVPDAGGARGRVVLARRQTLERASLGLSPAPFDVAVQETGDPTEERNCLVRCATLGSPFLCTCSYAFSAGHWLVLAMPLYSGGSLETVINERGEFGMGDDDLLWVAANMALGLDALHSLGLLHRDIKPDNVMVSGDGYLALGDYGLVSHIGISDRHGSRSYWSPECVNEDPQGTFSDWWSYGVTIAQCSTGRHPFMRRWVRSHKGVPDAPPPPWDEAKVDVNIDQWKAPNEADLDEADLNYNTLYKPVEFKAEGPHVDLIKACLDRDTAAHSGVQRRTAFHSVPQRSAAFRSSLLVRANNTPTLPPAPATQEDSRLEWARDQRAPFLRRAHRLGPAREAAATLADRAQQPADLRAPARPTARDHRGRFTRTHT
eukprot:5814998-Prymnesium_polylepis.1